MPTADEISGTDELVTAILAMADAAKNETPLIAVAIAYAEMALACEQSEEVARFIIKKTLKRMYANSYPFSAPSPNMAQDDERYSQDPCRRNHQETDKAR